MANPENEDIAIEYVLQLEQAAGRKPHDTRKTGDPVDVISPPRLIEVKAFGRSARGQPIPLEKRQVDALHAHPNAFSDRTSNVDQAGSLRSPRGACPRFAAGGAASDAGEM